MQQLITIIIKQFSCFMNNNPFLTKMKIKAKKFLSTKNEVTVFKLNSLVCWLQGCVKKPIILHADWLSVATGKFLAMEKYTKGG